MERSWKMTARSSILVTASFLAAATGIAGQGMVETCRQMSLSMASPRWTSPPRRLALSVPDVRPAPSSGSALDKDARRAAVRTARRLAGEGRRQAHRLGFYEGLHMALEDAELERNAYRWGLDRGRRSPEARRTGAELGYKAAEQDVLQRGRAESRRGWHRTRPTLREPALARLEKQAPDLEQIFREYPLTDVLLIVLLDVRYLEDPWSLYQEPRGDEVYDGGWQEASTALLKWLEENPQDRQRHEFQELFLYHYPRELISVLGDDLPSAYTEGVVDGWRYGFVVQSASSCRRGYARGWNETMRSGALTAFRRGLRGTRGPRSPLSSPRQAAKRRPGQGQGEARRDDSVASNARGAGHGR